MSQPGLSLSRFTDFVALTRDHHMDLNVSILNDSARMNYEILDMTGGQEEQEIIQGGKTIKTFVRLKRHQAAQNYRPNEKMSPRGINVIDELTVPWRFTATNFSWAEEPVDLNDGGVERLVDMLDEWRKATRQDVFDHMEESLFATPDAAEMESSEGATPYSLFAFMTDDGMLPSGFSTLQGLADHPNYRNQVETYVPATINATLEGAFMGMWMKLLWKAPPSAQAWFQSTDWKKFKILTDTNGVRRYIAAMTASGSRLVPVEDPGKYVANPTYANIPIEGVALLDERAWPNSRYLWRDSRYIKPVFHQKRFMFENDPIRGGAEQPFSWVVYNKTYWNLICKSRRRLGVIRAA